MYEGKHLHSLVTCYFTVCLSTLHSVHSAVFITNRNDPTCNVLICVRNWHLLQWVLPPLKYKDKTRRALATKERYNMEKQEAKSHLQMVLKTIGFADWLVIYMVARNIDRWSQD